ncbi:MAG: sulfatase [Pirellulales bacterium]
MRYLAGKKRASLWTAIVLILAVFAADVAVAQTAESQQPQRLNILWISCEDMSPDLGCYGDDYARSPNIDRLAAQGARFSRAFVPAGVCAVTRSGIITGMYPVSIGSQHMRSRIVPPPYVRCFTEYLRTAGYYCTNRSKTDYQFDPPLTAWDAQGDNHEDWRGRASGQPFFSVINLTTTHESQVRQGDEQFTRRTSELSEDQRHDPAEAKLPPYYPDTPVVRNDWARYHDLITVMDRQVGAILARLEADGLAESTVVMFWSDHGRGLPRGKRWIYDSGIHVPLVIRWPGQVAPGTVREDLVSLLDLPPTVLSVAGVTVPPYMHGRVIAGDAVGDEPRYLFAHRDRMDEAYDLIRAVRDRRYKYIRNFRPEMPYAQHIEYMDQMPTLQEMRRLNAEGKLEGPQQIFFRPTKPLEELYDLDADPHEVNNLARSPEHAERLAEMRGALEDWQVEIGDMGMVPEPVLMQRMRPTGKVEQTAEPKLTPGPDRVMREARLIAISCATPGATIAYRVRSKESDGQQPAGGDWKIYVSRVRLMPGETVEATAIRLGFQQSGVVSYTAPDATAARP